MTQKLYILRHGETDWNVEGRLQGQTDVPLNDTGRAQAAALQCQISSLDIEACYSSPLIRAHDTAKIAVATHRAALIPVLRSDLQERNFGRMNGMLKQDIDIDRVENRHLYTPVDSTGRLYPHDCEPEQDFQVRIERMISILIAAHQRPILLVSHGGAIRQIFRYLLQTHDIPSPENCEIYELVHEDVWRIKTT